jgi:hypothetical protein
MATQYLAFVIQFGVSVIISRLYLSPAEFGVYSVALASSMLVSMFQDAGITRFVSGQQAMDPAHVRDYAGIAVSIACGVAVVLGALAPVIGYFYGNPTLVPLTLIIAGASFISPFALIPVGLLTREMNFRALFIANISSALSGGLLSIYLASRGIGPSALAWGLLLAAILRTGLVMRFRPVWPRIPREWATARPLLSFSANSFFISASGAIGMRTQDLIVARLLGVTATGLFSRATALSAQLSTLVTSGLTSVFYSAFARKRDAGDPLAPSYLHLTACNTAVNWAAMVGLGLAAGPLVHLLYGPKWAGVVPLLKWTAISETLFGDPAANGCADPVGSHPHIDLGELDRHRHHSGLPHHRLLHRRRSGGGQSHRLWSNLGGYLWRISGPPDALSFSQPAQHLLAQRGGGLWRGHSLDYCAKLAGHGRGRHWLGLADCAFAGGHSCWLACLFLVRHPATIEIRNIGLRMYSIGMEKLGRRSAA